MTTSTTLYAFAGRSESREIALCLHPVDALMATYPTQGLERCVVADAATGKRYRIQDAHLGALRAFEVLPGKSLGAARRLRTIAASRLQDPEEARRVADVACAIRDAGWNRILMSELCALLSLGSDVTAREVEDALRNRLDLLGALVGSPLTLVDGGRADLLAVNVLAEVA